MKELTDEERTEMLRRSIARKVDKDPQAHEEIYKRIEAEIIAPLYKWHSIGKPQNVITAETTTLLEKLERAIYMTFKHHQDDKNNRKGQK